MNFLSQFRAICGNYSLTAIKRSPVNSNWTCSVYRGGKRIGTASHIDEIKPSIFDSKPTQYNIEPVEEKTLLEWIDKAGPYGFESIEEFLETVMAWVVLLKKMDRLVKEQRLVAVDTHYLDPHNMPKEFESTRRKVDARWIKDYKKSYSERMAVVNGMWH